MINRATHKPKTSQNTVTSIQVNLNKTLTLRKSLTKRLAFTPGIVSF